MQKRITDIEGLIFGIVEGFHKHIAERLRKSDFMPMPCGVKFRIAVTPAVIFLLRDLPSFEHGRSLPPSSEHFVQPCGIFALEQINFQTDFPICLIDLEAVSVIQCEQRVHQTNIGINVRHSQSLRRNIQSVCKLFLRHAPHIAEKMDSKPVIDEATGEPLLISGGKPVLKKSYSVLQDDFFQHMRSAGYADVERGERGSSEEHLTVTQFKVEREQERLAGLTEKTEQKAQKAVFLEKKIEKIQKKQIAVQAVEQIEAKPVPLSSKVMLERSEYETLATAAKRYIAQEKKESKLQKALDAANKMTSELKSKVASLAKELSEYKSICGKLHTAGSEQENVALKDKLRSYEAVIERNNLWPYFSKHSGKTHARDDAR